jgi:hypothetical protein
MYQLSSIFAAIPIQDSCEAIPDQAVTQLDANGGPGTDMHRFASRALKHPRLYMLAL